MLEGLSQFTDTLRGLPPALRRAAATALDAAGEHIAARAAELAPRQTGALAESIDHAAALDEPLTIDIGPAVGVSRFDQADGTLHIPADYAETVEFGDETQKPEPFLRPALDEWAAAAESGIARTVESALQ